MFFQSWKEYVVEPWVRFRGFGTCRAGVGESPDSDICGVLARAGQLGVFKRFSLGSGECAILRGHN